MDLEVIKAAAKSWTVLIVDDNLDNLTVASHILQFCDATVHTTRSGEEALKLLEQNPISFVLLDLAMPYMDGWQAFDKIRGNPRYAHIPVIAVSAQVNDKDKALETGFTGFIPKPFSMQPFLDAIYDYLIVEEAVDTEKDLPVTLYTADDTSQPSLRQNEVTETPDAETTVDLEDTPESKS